MSEENKQTTTPTTRPAAKKPFTKNPARGGASFGNKTGGSFSGKGGPRGDRPQRTWLVHQCAIFYRWRVLKMLLQKFIQVQKIN